jgi:hypothetical protein
MLTQDAAKSKVADLHASTGVKKNVLRLDIPVKDAHAVKVMEALRHQRGQNRQATCAI